MKKVFLTFLLVCIIAVSFNVTAMANDTILIEPINVYVEQQEVEPFSEHTWFYYRWCPCGCARLQWRVWGMTSGRWLTEWAYV